MYQTAGYLGHSPGMIQYILQASRAWVKFYLMSTPSSSKPLPEILIRLLEQFASLHSGTALPRSRLAARHFWASEWL